MKALDVAKYFLNKANNDGELITNLKLQKLLYYAQAWYLVNFHKPLFNDEINAWRFGPVVESTYHQFKKFRHTPINYKNKESIEKRFSRIDREYLDEFYAVYINYSAFDLLNMSHNDAPWKDAFESSLEIIDTEKMEEFYTKKYEEIVG